MGVLFLLISIWEANRIFAKEYLIQINNEENMLKLKNSFV